MFNLKYSAIFAITAFILSLLIGLISRASMPMLIIRPLVFAAVFFAVSAGVKILLDRFLPELTEGGDQNDGVLQLGSRINIMDDGVQAYPGGDFNPAAQGQTFAGARPDESDEGLEDISELTVKNTFHRSTDEDVFPPSGMDQKPEDGYTREESVGDFAEPAMGKLLGQDVSFEAPPERSFSSSQSTRPPEKSQAKAASSRKTEIYNSEEVLPDLDSMAGAFMSASSNEEPQREEYSVSDGPLKRPSSKKAPDWAAEFNPKDMAKGLQTVLKKDKEG